MQNERSCDWKKDHFPSQAFRGFATLRVNENKSASQFRRGSWDFRFLSFLIRIGFEHRKSVCGFSLFRLWGFGKISRAFS